MDPWAEAALWHGLHELAPPAAPISRSELLGAQRLSPLLLRYLDAHGVPTAPEVRQALEMSAFGWSTFSTLASRNGAHVVRELQRVGIDCVVSKGPSIAAHYPAPQLRPYSDLDLLLPADAYTRALTHLHAAGFVPTANSEQPWSFFDRRCREGVNLHKQGGTHVDLHHRVPPWIWSDGLAPDKLMARSRSVESHGEVLPALGAEDNLLVAALHLVSDRNLAGANLLIWRDIAQLARAADPATVVDRAREARLDGWLRNVLLALPEPVRPHPLLDALSSSARPQEIPHAARLATLLSPVPSRLGARAYQVLRLPLPAAALCLAGAAVPSRPFLAATSDTDASYARMWVRRAFRVRRDLKSRSVS
ncbi:nucleotidyltransferase family protein [Motilibacter deserti]|uniref:Nucleotidyltransferase family protein n=1 Tax=Motilibacter deserti TaxID=2714956 RepID=A0ABX0GRC7_9ACTN|nr:nucleotidyltransferase family protein [Motilibacter deserti]NHC13423.1 nucleotidyltransferase family protein [Motilibacter deserti]